MKTQLKKLIAKYKKEWEYMGQATSYSSVVADLEKIVENEQIGVEWKGVKYFVFLIEEDGERHWYSARSEIEAIQIHCEYQSMGIHQIDKEATIRKIDEAELDKHTVTNTEYMSLEDWNDSRSNQVSKEEYDDMYEINWESMTMRQAQANTVGAELLATSDI